MPDTFANQEFEAVDTMRPTFQAILDARKLGNGAPHQIIPRIIGVLDAQKASSTFLNLMAPTSPELNVVRSKDKFARSATY